MVIFHCYVSSPEGNLMPENGITSPLTSPNVGDWWPEPPEWLSPAGIFRHTWYDMALEEYVSSASPAGDFFAESWTQWHWDPLGIPPLIPLRCGQRLWKGGAIQSPASPLRVKI